MRTAIWLACVAAIAPSALRWLRVAQREHYAPGRVTRFAVRWWSMGFNAVLLVVAIGSAAVAAVLPGSALICALVMSACPLGLGVRGTSSKLRWTARLRRLALAQGLAVAVLLAAGALAAMAIPFAAVASIVLPVASDGLLRILLPIERRLSRVWITKAQELLRQIGPKVVAITGSYGKTTTKAYASQLLSGRFRLVASPASFNNELGLARTINEHLAPGTEVLLAEMGSYGQGEIASMVSWMRPSVSVITSIGPVHLERFGSVERIVLAKSEILSEADTAVLGVDSPELEALADIMGGSVIRCSCKNPAADVFVGEGDGRVVVAGNELTVLPEPPSFAMNLACAIGTALALGVTVDAQSLARVETPSHRRERLVGSSGFEIIDDTYNSNPAGARAAVQLLEGRKGRTVVVTPGMVELGSVQRGANVELGRSAARVATDLVIVGRTNRRALQEGAKDGPAAVRLVRSREEAVEWVRHALGPGDVVLYENDLPDHYP